MNDPVRDFLIKIAREDKKRADAEGLTLADIQSPEPIELDRDDMKPLREIVAAMLGLRPMAHEWAAEYGPYARDAAARDSLALLVKRTNLLANELKTGATDLKPGDKVRVDKVIDIAVARGWTRPTDLPSVPAVTVHSTKQRSRVLTPEIEEAQNRCGSKTDVQRVWQALQALAEENFSILRGSDQDGVKYLREGEAAWFTRKHLADRMRPRKRGNAQ